MKPHWLLPVLAGLFYLALVQAREALPETADRTVTPISWPPQHMRDLPPDYLERQRASLVAGTNRLSRVRLGDSEGTDSIGWVRYGMPALVLGKRVDDINRFFESDKFVWSTNPKFGFSLFSVSYMRMYGLMNLRTGPMKGLLS